MAGSPQYAHYELRNITCIFGGILIDGYGADDAVTVAFDVEAFTKTVGVDGLAVRNKMHDRTGTITITLSYASATNDQLSGVYQADQLASTGAGVGPFTLRDRGGRTLFEAPYAWICDTPDLNFNSEAGSRVWMLHFQSGTMFAGGA